MVPIPKLFTDKQYQLNSEYLKALNAYNFYKDSFQKFKILAWQDIKFYAECKRDYESREYWCKRCSELREKGATICYYLPARE